MNSVNDLPQSRGIHAAVAFVLGATCVPLVESSYVPTSSASFTAATANLPVGRAVLGADFDNGQTEVSTER